MIKLKRAYEAPDPADGTRYLVDRLWPRGRTKEALQIEAWLKDLSPSPELRRWFCHDPELWEQFQERYRQELSDPAKGEALERLARQAGQGTVTLVYAAKDQERNNAQVLALVLAQVLAALPSAG
jgi:uncharacterized protein YeaO (DUF488 family)